MSLATGYEPTSTQRSSRCWRRRPAHLIRRRSCERSLSLGTQSFVIDTRANSARSVPLSSLMRRECRYLPRVSSRPQALDRGGSPQPRVSRNLAPRRASVQHLSPVAHRQRPPRHHHHRWRIRSLPWPRAMPGSRCRATPQRQIQRRHRRALHQAHHLQNQPRHHRRLRQALPKAVVHSSALPPPVRRLDRDD